MSRGLPAPGIVLLVLSGVLGVGCSGESAERGVVDAWLTETPHCTDGLAALFEDVTVESGVTHMVTLDLDLPHYRGNIGGGVVFEDLDGDGDLDLYLTAQQGPNTLWLNDGDGHFSRAASSEEVAFVADWTIGAAAADLDNDGLPEIYLANDGPDRILRNEGQGRFVDVTSAWGLDRPGRSAGASFGDYDADGYLDVFVATLASEYTPENGTVVPDESVVLRNLGGHGFEPLALEEPLVGSTYAGGFIDLDDDGDVDLYTSQEFGNLDAPRLLENVDGRFEDRTEDAGIEVPTAAMGVAAFDADRDGMLDLALSNLFRAMPNREVLLVRDAAPLRFVDVGDERRATAMTRFPERVDAARTVSWATLSWDVEHDGDEDLFFVYGRLIVGSEEATSESFGIHQPDQPDALLLNDGEGYFSIREGSCAEDFGEGRGAAVGDLDADGCLDLVVSNQRGAVRILRRICEDVGRSVQIDLVGTESNRDAIGARVQLEAGGRTQIRHVLGGVGGVHSSSSRRLHFGIGNSNVVDRVTVRWPSGLETTHAGMSADEPWRLVEPSP